MFESPAFIDPRRFYTAVMAQSEATRIYLLTSLSSEILTSIVERFHSAGFDVVYDQPTVMEAVNAFIPGDSQESAWVTVSEYGEARPDQELKAEGRLLGLETVDPALILFRAILNSDIPSETQNLVMSFGIDVNSFIPAAITYISKKLGERSAKSAEKREALAEVDRSLEQHIAPILFSLNHQEKSLWRASVAFYAVALMTLLAGLGIAFVKVHQLHEKPLLSWVDVVGSAVGGLIVIGMLTAVARLAFILGRSFMVESLTNGDRAHAISFGRFYLQIFKDKAEWAEIKEAFQNWNTDRGSSFSAQTAGDVDPIVLQVATEVAKAVAAKAKS